MPQLKEVSEMRVNPCLSHSDTHLCTHCMTYSAWKPARRLWLTESYNAHSCWRVEMLRMRSQKARPGQAQPVKIIFRPSWSVSPLPLFCLASPTLMLRPWKPFLSRLHPSYLTLYCSLVSFVLYFSSAAFENPTFSINYDGVQWVHGVELKTALALAQLSGFVVAKVVGMKLIPEMNRENSSRALALFACALTAQAGYILHAIVPIQFKVIGLFLTGYIVCLTTNTLYQS